MARARVTILWSIILDLNFLDLRKKEIRIELTTQTWYISTVVRYQRLRSIRVSRFPSPRQLQSAGWVADFRRPSSSSSFSSTVFARPFRRRFLEIVFTRFQPVISVTLQKSSEMLAFPLKPSRVVRHVTSRSLTNPRSNLVSFQKKERSLDFSFERESKWKSKMGKDRKNCTRTRFMFTAGRC